MCTVVVLFRIRDGEPLVVGANRDELYARPTGPFGVLPGTADVLGGTDRVAGGTWMGVAPSGFFVAVTNQRPTGIPEGRAPESRGQLVLRALQAGNVQGALGVIAAADARRLGPFNLLVGDTRELHVAYGRPEETGEVELHPLAPGLHVLNTDRIGAPGYPKAARARSLVEPALDRPLPELLEAMRTMLADHRLPPLEAIPDPEPTSPFSRSFLQALQALCIHTDRYGTRSSTLFAAGPLGLLHHEHSPRPPCTR